MKISVNNDSCELHYKFIHNFSNETNEDKNIAIHELIFMYAHGIPTFVCHSLNNTIYRFNSHELYEMCIQHLVDNFRHRYEMKSFINGEKQTGEDMEFMHFLFDDDGSTFIDYNKMSKTDKQETIQKIINNKDVSEGGDIIKNFEFFVNILIHYAPCYELQECGVCLKDVIFNELYIDIRWKCNDEDPSICQTCYEKLNESMKVFYKKPPEDADKICNIIGMYYHQYELQMNVE